MATAQNSAGCSRWPEPQTVAGRLRLEALEWRNLAGTEYREMAAVEQKLVGVLEEGAAEIERLEAELNLWRNRFAG
jgi:hypothetical protein